MKKNKILLVGFLVSSSVLYAQTPQQGNPPANNVNARAAAAWYRGGNETHAVFGGSGQISGQNNRFEFISTGATMGNYYSTFSATGIHRFDRGTTEQGRLGTNNNWRFGANTSGSVFGGLNAARKVEVVDNAIQLIRNPINLYLEQL